MAKRVDDKKRLTRAEIRWSKKARCWYLPINSKRALEFDADLLKRAALRKAIGVLQSIVAQGRAVGFSLRICRKDGAYQKGSAGERTIPKSADPRKSKC